MRAVATITAAARYYYKYYSFFTLSDVQVKGYKNTIAKTSDNAYNISLYGSSLSWHIRWKITGRECWPTKNDAQAQSYSVRDLTNMQNVLNRVSDRSSHLTGKRREKN